MGIAAHLEINVHDRASGTTLTQTVTTVDWDDAQRYLEVLLPEAPVDIGEHLPDSIKRWRAELVDEEGPLPTHLVDALDQWEAAAADPAAITWPGGWTPPADVPPFMVVRIS